MRCNTHTHIERTSTERTHARNVGKKMDCTAKWMERLIRREMWKIVYARWCWLESIHHHWQPEANLLISVWCVVDTFFPIWPFSCSLKMEEQHVYERNLKFIFGVAATRRQTFAFWRSSFKCQRDHRGLLSLWILNIKIGESKRTNTHKRTECHRPLPAQTSLRP